MNKDLILVHKKESYVKDGVAREFDKYVIHFNGIELEMKPADNTVRQVLKTYYEKGETKS